MANEDVMCQDNAVLLVVCRSIQPSEEVILVHSQAPVQEAINAINGKGLVVIDYNHEAENIGGWEKDIVFHNNPQADHCQYEGPVEKAQVPHPNSKPAYTDTGPDCGPKLSYNTSGPDGMIHNDAGDPSLSTGSKLFNNRGKGGKHWIRKGKEIGSSGCKKARFREGNLGYEKNCDDKGEQGQMDCQIGLEKGSVVDITSVSILTAEEAASDAFESTGRSPSARWSR
ncbi:hypothetical protein Q3G72_023091 [Acer saccharum]|nr:hypothetical protein Q3G72_023091 [Acer saccharum]